MIKTPLRSAQLVLLVLVAAPPAQAQFEQYTPSGEFGERAGGLREALDDAVAAAPWRAGRVRIAPWLELREIEFVDNVRASARGSEVSDVTATLGAGLKAYLPIGDLVAAAYLLPEYVWWRDLEGRRKLNGRYGAGLFGTVGRTDLQLTAARSESSRYFSRQLEERANVERNEAELAVEVRLAGGISLFGGADAREIGYPDNEAVLEDLSVADRDETELRLGLRFRSRRGLMLGLLWESTETDFRSARADRSNSGDSPVFELLYDSGTYYIQATLVQRSLEPVGASLFLPYDALTGELRLAWSPIPPLEAQLFANRNLVYTTGTQWAYFEDDSVGGAARLSLGSRAKVRLFVERGDNDYTPFAGQAARLDDFDAYGGDFEVVFGRARLGLGARRTRYDSDLAGLDREITVLRVGLAIRGGSGSPWT